MGGIGRTVVNVRVGGPNAGHTVLGRCPKGCAGGHDQPVRVGGPGSAVPLAHDAHPWRLRQVPVAAVTNPSAQLIIAAGSEVDLGVLAAEIEQLDTAGYHVTGRLIVDRSATVLTLDHKVEERDIGLQGRLGSTAKGIGAARASRIWRRAATFSSVDRWGLSADTAPILAEHLRHNAAVVVEGTQGYGLGLHTENYPYTTSGDCRAVDFLAQAGISPWQTLGHPMYPSALRVVVCLRPYPIRVAGNSGGLKGETSWEELGLPVELTTVTQKVRRVGEWDADLAKAAIAANGGPMRGAVWVAMTMMDSVEPALSGYNAYCRGWMPTTTPKSALDYVHSIGLDTRSLGYVGTGPDTAIVNEEMYA